MSLRGTEQSEPGISSSCPNLPTPSLCPSRGSSDSLPVPWGRWGTPGMFPVPVSGNFTSPQRSDTDPTLCLAPSYAWLPNLNTPAWDYPGNVLLPSVFHVFIPPNGKTRLFLSQLCGGTFPWPNPDPEMEESGITGQRKEGREVSQGSPVPGMVLCTGLTERGPKDPEVETWAGTEAGSEHLAL